MTVLDPSIDPVPALSRRDAAWVLLALAGRPAMAHPNYPYRPLRLVVQYPPGGTSDTLARLLGHGLAHQLRQPVLVENRSGANGIIATDGYTLLLTSPAPISSNLVFYKHLPYDPRTDLSMVSDVANLQSVLCVHPSVDVHDFKGLIGQIRQNPNAFAIGSWGPGSQPHQIQAYMQKTYHLRLLHVSYRGETAMLLDLLSRQINMTVASLTFLRSHIEAGRLRALAVTGLHRAALLPQVPTFAEQGFVDDIFTLRAPLSLMVPSATPHDIVDRLSSEVQLVLRDPVIRAQFIELGTEPLGNSAAEAAAHYAQRLPTVLRLARATGIHFD